MYAIFLDEAFGHGDYNLFVGATKTKVDAKKLVKRCLAETKKRVIDDQPTEKDFDIKKLTIIGFDKDVLDELRGE